MKSSVLSMMIAVSVITASFAQEKRYGIESAILKKNTIVKFQGFERTVSSIQYIADYGMKESTEIIMEMQGQTVTTFSMMKDGYIYVANLAEKQGTKIKVAAEKDFKTFNFLNLTDEMKEKYQIVELGEVQFLGKECKSYEMTVTEQGQTVRAIILVWQGIPLKSSMTVSIATVVDEVTEIQEGVEIAMEKFGLPEGINFVERNTQTLQQQKEHILKGRTAPNFTLPDLAGESVSLSNLKGKYIVLDFWGSWCGPCMRGMPEMKKYYEKYKDRLEFVGIACRDKDAGWRNAVETNELNWIQLKNNDIEDAAKNVSSIYSVGAYPTKFILDKDLKIVAVFQGEREEFYSNLDTLLNDSE